MANFNFNKVILGGRLTSDPELKTTPSGVPVTSFRLAVNRRGKGEGEGTSDFFSVTAWRATAEFVTKYFHKGSSICVVGSLQTREWNDNEGRKRSVTEIVADEAQFVDSKGESGGGQGYASPNLTPPGYQSPAPAPAPTAAPKWETIEDDDSLPF